MGNPGQNKELIPKCPGVYAWYFDNHLVRLFPDNDQDFITIDFDTGSNTEWFLLYIGMAGQKKSRTLRDRIYSEHLNQNSEGSTLRQSLAAVLWQNIDLDASKQLNGEDEKWKLNSWLFFHAKVAWAETDDAEVVEDLMLDEFGEYLYFNIQDNKANPYRKDLQKLRKQWRESG